MEKTIMAVDEYECLGYCKTNEKCMSFWFQPLTNKNLGACKLKHSIRVNPLFRRRENCPKYMNEFYFHKVPYNGAKSGVVRLVNADSAA